VKIKSTKLSNQSLELAKLKKENPQLKMELELLKKSTVYFKLFTSEPNIVLNIKS
jgi:transposase-like protein